MSRDTVPGMVYRRQQASISPAEIDRNLFWIFPVFSCPRVFVDFLILSTIPPSMAVTKARKVEVLAELEALLRTATSVTFTTNQKLTVLDVTTMRVDLRKAGATFMLAKKTLIRLAFKNVLNVEIDDKLLPGQVGILVATKDALAPIAIVNKYALEWRKEQKIDFAGAYFDGRLLGADETRRLATLPSREVLLAKLLGSMKSPIAGLARFFDAARQELEKQGVAKVGALTKTEKASAPAETPTEEAAA